MKKGITSLLMIWQVLQPFATWSIAARLAHETGNGNASRRVASDSFDFESEADLVSLTVFARRDAFAADRNVTNAIALAGASVSLEGHHFLFSLGSHYRQERLAARELLPGAFYPALGFRWSHALFRTEMTGSEYATRASASLLLNLGIPFEINSEFEYLFSQPYRWATQTYAFLSPYGGLIFGYEPLSQTARAGLWLSPNDVLKLRTLARLSSASETYFEFSLSYSMESPANGQSNSVAIDSEKLPVSRPGRLPQKVPAFATLVKWGLAPVEALRFTREKDACALSPAAQTALARKNWGCRNAT
jgi:hypothetical protein